MPRILTIGYQGLTPEQFVTALEAAGVSTLADVRIRTHSRKPGFNARALEERLEAAGVGYVWLKGLGSPESVREAGRSGDLQAMHALYAHHLDSPAAQDDYATLKGLALDEDVCLMCFEAEVEECHRKGLAERLAADTGMPIVHLKPGSAPELQL